MKDDSLEVFLLIAFAVVGVISYHVDFLGLEQAISFL